MIYYQSKTGKFPYMIIEPLTGRNNYIEKSKWIKENIGEYRIDWISTVGITDGKKKVYLRDVKYNRDIMDNPTKNTGRQWCFDTEAKAMAFKIRWQT